MLDCVVHRPSAKTGVPRPGRQAKSEGRSDATHSKSKIPMSPQRPASWTQAVTQSVGGGEPEHWASAEMRQDAEQTRTKVKFWSSAAASPPGDSDTSEPASVTGAPSNVTTSAIASRLTVLPSSQPSKTNVRQVNACLDHVRNGQTIDESTAQVLAAIRAKPKSGPNKATD